MSRTDGERLRDLGRGMGIAELSAIEGWDRRGFDRWWQGRLQDRTSSVEGLLPAAVTSDVTILRDARGIPHCFADDDDDLFLAYGYTMAVDRLFQMDIRRRKGTGRLAALLGPEGIADDRVAHTMALPGLAVAELERLDPETKYLLDRFAAGIGLAVAAMGERLPIEYALLGADSEPWSALDCIAATVAWRWQFTGRPHVIAGPELMKRRLTDDRLVELILATDREADTATLPPDSVYPPAQADPAWPPGSAPDGRGPGADMPGSNDWVMSGRWSRSGRPLLASDPHMPYEWASAFFEVGLHGGSFDAVGAGLVGVPGMVMGRNRQIAWGFTNNLCSLRDMYQERPVEGVPDSYEYDGHAVAAERTRVSFEVRDADPVVIDVVRTRRGPLVDEILPSPARDTGPVSMLWLGTEPCSWPRALLDLTRADSVDAARRAVRGWLVPSFGLALADVEGSIGFVATGRVPLRSRPTRTYRDGADPSDRWVGLIPDEAMPQSVDPERGWLASANNRPAPDDFPYPLSGTWAEGYRVRRVGRLIEALDPGTADRATLTSMHLDVLTPRAEELVEPLITLLEPGDTAQARAALDVLRGWDGHTSPGSAAAAIFEIFFHRFAQALMAVRIPDRRQADFLSGWALGLATSVLRGDGDEWLAEPARTQLVRATFAEALQELEAALGPEPGTWRWGALHHLTLRHVLSGRGDLGELLDIRVGEVGGSLATLSNSGFDATRPTGPGVDGNRGWRPSSGAGYRLEIDLGEDPPAVWTITLESQSGVPGSAHYGDQIDDFLHGTTHRLPLDRAEVEAEARYRQMLVATIDRGAEDAGARST